MKRRDLLKAGVGAAGAAASRAPKDASIRSVRLAGAAGAHDAVGSDQRDHAATAQVDPAVFFF